MNSSYIVLFLIVFLILYMNKRRNNLLQILRIKRRKREKFMPHMIEKFIGKDCIINLGSGGTADGIVKAVSEGWIEIEDKSGNSQVVNIDYISRIREYPTNKNGKRKVVIE